MITPKNALAGLFAAWALLAAEPAAAQGMEAGLHAGSLEVPINKSQVVTADRPISKAMVGNPAILDVLPISERSIYVLGKAMGTTSLTMYDRLNRVIAVMDVEVGPDIVGLRTQIQQLVPGQSIDARLSNGSIVLTGMVNNPGAADRAALLAKAYAGEKVINLVSLGGSQQVMLEVRFAEVNRQLGERLGVSGFGFSRGGSFSGAVGEGASLSGGTTTSIVSTSDALGNLINTTTSTNPAQLKLGAIADAFGVFTKAFSIGNTDITATLDLLERRGLSKTLAEPTLVAISGEKASFLAGGEFPIPVAQGSNTGGNANVSVEFKPFGVSLAFTPTVLGDKVISLIVEPEVSSIDPSASVSINGLVIPGLQTRRASTTVELRDGESFAIAGLIRRDFQTTVRSLPGLGSIPIIGALFRSSSFQKGETELLIVVTPRLVAPIRPQQVRMPTDRISDQRAIDVLLDGEGYRPKALAPNTSPPAATDAAPASTAKPDALSPSQAIDSQAQQPGELAPLRLPPPAGAPDTTPREKGYEY